MNEKTRTHCSPSCQYIHSSFRFNCRSCHFFRTPWIDSRSLNIYIHSLNTRTTELCLSGARGWVGGGGGSSLQDCLPFLVCPPQAIQTKAAACEGLATRLCRIRTWLTKLRYNHIAGCWWGVLTTNPFTKKKCAWVIKAGPVLLQTNPAWNICISDSCCYRCSLEWKDCFFPADHMLQSSLFSQLSRTVEALDGAWTLTVHFWPITDSSFHSWFRSPESHTNPLSV